MKIGIDVRYLSHGLVGGVHTYVACLIAALLRCAPDDAFFLYADAKAPLELETLPTNAHLRMLPYHSAVSSVVNDLRLRTAMAMDGVEVAHFPANYGFGPENARTVITLHDAINLLPLYEIIRGHRKDPRTMASMSYLHFQTVAAVRKASLLITVSRYSKAEILRLADVEPSRVVPITHGPAPLFAEEFSAEQLADIRQRHGIRHPFVMADALKNPTVLTAAWAQLPQATRHAYRLLFFCRRPDPPPAVLAAVQAGDAYLLIRPSFKDLIGLYHMTEAFVFPSLIEGLGLPILEAMQCGAPVIASDRGSIPEVAGGAALHADAEDAAGFARHIGAVLGDRELRCRLAQLGRERAARFTWQNTASRVLEVYRQAAALPDPIRKTAASTAAPVVQQSKGSKL
jgi:hypothetical protein